MPCANAPLRSLRKLQQSALMDLEKLCVMYEILQFLNDGR